jgi:hypothetical protein
MRLVRNSWLNESEQQLPSSVRGVSHSTGARLVTLHTQITVLRAYQRSLQRPICTDELFRLAGPLQEHATTLFALTAALQAKQMAPEADRISTMESGFSGLLGHPLSGAPAKSGSTAAVGHSGLVITYHVLRDQRPPVNWAATPLMDMIGKPPRNCWFDCWRNWVLRSL